MRALTFRMLSWGAALAVGATACGRDWDQYDPRLAEGTGGSQGTGGGGTGGGGAGGDDTGGTGGAGGAQQPCAGDTFECLPNGSAHHCVNDAWVELGPCPLGCDVGSRSCGVPSNVDAAELLAGSSPLVLAGAADTVFDTDTGEITRGGNQLRPPVAGLDPGTGIAFATQAQGGSEPGLGVFSMAGLTVPAGTTLRGAGTNALVLLVDGDVTIHGLVTVAASSQSAGPGGHAGGAAGAPGGGACGGLLGSGTPVSNGCSSGSGGAGHPAAGGTGGASTCSAPDGHVGGLGGPGTCGTPALVPLVGGSGGGGGVVIPNFGSQAGPGGGGGGAVQITATGTLTVSATGRIDAGGGGGGETVTGGGAGGGAGGAILLEAPAVTVATGAILAANGGGGGAGDCT
ncbi:MAG: hypothetical protein IT373_05370 [Polyangiaceae bacterium]|nr:hypothetical protein [Polyangiaceae bacterium]